MDPPGCQVINHHRDVILTQRLKKKMAVAHHVSHEEKNSYFPLYWLFNRDPYYGLL